jgi:succinoglycan biosynthesis protein ExoA
MTRPNYSAVIAIDRPDKSIPAIKSLLSLPPAERPAEIFVSVGRNPSTQRNRGLDLCKNPFVYFLDEDSWVLPSTPALLMSHFRGELTAAVGGPNLPFPDATEFEKTVSSVLASWLGSFKVRNRYASIGSVKEATEKDLILCNMMVRREVFQKEGGFRAHLYPNEENEFLNRLIHLDYQLIYDPAAAVYRPRRKNLGAFCYQAFRYGRGRARQMKVYPCLSDIVHLVPAFFVVYLLSLALPLVFPALSFPWIGIFRSYFWWSPLCLFALLALGTGISAASWHRRFLDSFKVPALIFLRQFFYGLGLMTGFFTSIPQPAQAVEVFRVRWSGNAYRLISLSPRGANPRGKK